MAGEYGNHQDLPIATQARSIVYIPGPRFQKNTTEIIRIQSDRLCLPPDQIAAGYVAPVHGCLDRRLRIVVKKKAVCSLIIYKAVRIIHPVLFKRKMDLKTVSFSAIWPVLPVLSHNPELSCNNILARKKRLIRIVFSNFNFNLLGPFGSGNKKLYQILFNSQ